MKAFCLVLAAALLAVGSAQAQLVDQPSPPQFEVRIPAQAQPFAGSFQVFPRSYMRNETAIPDVKLFEDYRTDPKLRAGYDLTPTLAIEAGYANLFSRGFRHVDYGRADERAGALGAKGFSSYLAGKYMVPVGERFTAYGKLGVAVSERKTRDKTDVDVGPYANVGARYKLSEKASVTGEYEHYGDSARKWGGATNATGVNAKLKLGF
jgi:opacity protein-like surface antigen